MYFYWCNIIFTGLVALNIISHLDIKKYSFNNPYLYMHLNFIANSLRWEIAKPAGKGRHIVFKIRNIRRIRPIRGENNTREGKMLMKLYVFLFLA